MKLTTARLKQLIREELEKVTEMYQGEQGLHSDRNQRDAMNIVIQQAQESDENVDIAKLKKALADMNDMRANAPRKAYGVQFNSIASKYGIDQGALRNYADKVAGDSITV